MSSNKKVKEELIRRYGNKCFIERLKLRDTRGLKYKGCGQYKRMKQLTYHHIRMKKNGGRATIENGALLSAENHQWFHKQSMAKQSTMNYMFQELKRKIDSGEIPVEVVDEIECPLQILGLELTPLENGELHFELPELDKGEFELPRLDKKEIEARERRKEEKKWQRKRKEIEDR
jgi:hypothetical protein